MKLKLKLEDLNVTTFATNAVTDGRGTVRGHISAQTGEATCSSCGWTAELTICYGPCDGASGLSCDCATIGCTADPKNAYCNNSLNYCPDTYSCGLGGWGCD